MGALETRQKTVAVPDPLNIPEELRKTPQWVLWTTVEREGKITKVPVAPWTAGHWGPADATDPKNWTDFTTALEWAKKRDGVGLGFAFKEGGGIVGIDLDRCIDEDGLISEFAAEVIRRAKSYCEVSPSGRGVHIFVKGKLDNPITAKEYGVEAYGGRRFFTITGRRWKDGPLEIREAQGLLDQLARKFKRVETKVVRFAGVDDQATFTIDKVVDLTKLKQRGDEYQGPHPIHGSETGMNFAVNLVKNTWFCFRHWCGGGPLSLAITEGIIECGQPLKGEAYRKALTIAAERGLYVDPIQKEITQIEPTEMDEITREIGIDDLKKILGATIKHDDINKVIHLLALVLTYTEDGQINISNRGPSSSGKSYIPIEMTRYVPAEDVIMVAYSSPTAFWHDSGEWDEKDKTIKINLERKVLIFLDQPHDELLRRLRPLLSHDRKDLLVKITDKREKAGMRTKNVIVRGFPTVFFCTGSLRIDDQEATRTVVLSPETSQEKIREALYLKAQRKGNPIEFAELLKNDIEGERLRKRILLIRRSGIKRAIIKDHKKVAERFISKYPHLQPRHARDLERVISFAQAFALLNLWRREKENDVIYANEVDIENSFRIYEEIAECQNLGLPPYTYQIYKEVIAPLITEVNQLITREGGVDTVNFVGKREILKRYYETYGRPLNLITLEREILPSLIGAGLIIEEPDPNNKRRHVYFLSADTTPPLRVINQRQSTDTTPPLNSLYSKKCDKCGHPIDGLVVYSESGLALCQKCAQDYPGRL